MRLIKESLKLLKIIVRSKYQLQDDEAHYLKSYTIGTKQYA